MPAHKAWIFDKSCPSPFSMPKELLKHLPQDQLIPLAQLHARINTIKLRYFSLGKKVPHEEHLLSLLCDAMDVGKECQKIICAMGEGPGQVRPCLREKIQDELTGLWAICRFMLNRLRDVERINEDLRARLDLVNKGSRWPPCAWRYFFIGSLLLMSVGSFFFT